MGKGRFGTCAWAVVGGHVRTGAAERVPESEAHEGVEASPEQRPDRITRGGGSSRGVSWGHRWGGGGDGVSFVISLPS